MAEILAEKTNPGASERRKGFHGMCLFQCSLLDTLKGHEENIREKYVRAERALNS
jgi:hypothetical protein